VQTEWTVEEGGDGQWYAGTVVALYPGGGAAVEHDDGELWTGSLSSVYTLRGESDDEERGLGGLRGLPVAAPVAAHERGAGAYPGVQVAVPVAQIPTTVGVPVAAASRCGLPQAVARPV